VQKDLLPLLEGTTVQVSKIPEHNITENNPIDVKTNHILFICSGAFSTSSPQDLLSEFLGRLPIKVNLLPLSEEDMYRILVEPELSLIKQQQALFKTEGIDLTFEEEAVKKLAHSAWLDNDQGQNFGARRLFTTMDKVVEPYSYACDEYRGKKVTITADKVDEALGEAWDKVDYSSYIM